MESMEAERRVEIIDSVTCVKGGGVYREGQVVIYI